MRCHDKDLEEDLRPAKDVLKGATHSYRGSNDLECIAKVENVRVLPSKLAQDPAAVCRDYRHDEDHDDAGHQSESGEH